MEGCVSSSQEEKLKRGHVLKLTLLLTAAQGQRRAKTHPDSRGQPEPLPGGLWFPPQLPENRNSGAQGTCLL